MGAPDVHPPARPIGRRVILGMLGVGAAGVLVGQQVERGIGSALRPLASTGVTGLVPGGGGFTFYTVTSGFPAAPPGYRLEVDGMVRRPLSLGVRDLEGMPAVHLTHTFQCVTGWQVPSVHWVGVRLTDLAERAGASPAATAFRFASFDGLYTESLTRLQAEQTGALVAYSMLGGPVTRAHGGPLRLFVPGMFGYKSIKWLSRISLVDRVTPGYWEQNGYPVDAWITGHAPGTA